ALLVQDEAQALLFLANLLVTSLRPFSSGFRQSFGCSLYYQQFSRKTILAVSYYLNEIRPRVFLNLSLFGSILTVTEI
uniref:Uncharacterized protein n=1 Tax=Aegilops tauschii subsp. strangulata TaxID=200361 RepID=A0A453MGI7_AEGTS